MKYFTAAVNVPLPPAQDGVHDALDTAVLRDIPTLLIWCQQQNIAIALFSLGTTGMTDSSKFKAWHDEIITAASISFV